jgi:hypothetical protein
LSFLQVGLKFFSLLISNENIIDKILLLISNENIIDKISRNSAATSRDKCLFILPITASPVQDLLKVIEYLIKYTKDNHARVEIHYEIVRGRRYITHIELIDIYMRKGTKKEK